VRNHHDVAGAFIIVDHDEQVEVEARAPVSSVYASGIAPSVFTLALRHNFRRGYISDFARVEGVPGPRGTLSARAVSGSGQ
jgi:hypothetical protein